LRARHPEHGVRPPAEFLPTTGDPLYQPLTGFVIRRAMTDWRRFAELGMQLKLSVNVPISVLHTPDFITLVRQHLPTDPTFPGLIAEVTEDEVIRDPEQVHEAATQLKLYNVTISIDDFGSAYSSLSRFLALPCSELKLDRSFVSDCSSDKLKRALCQTAIDLAHRFHIAVCGEGVENAEDLRALIDMGCDTVQGFLFARPMTADELVQMLGRQATQAPGASAPVIELGAARARKSAG
jgi:EAL domain-containing protein (putative c-di-GMP-specific phosphodiesterase class I)